MAKPKRGPIVPLPPPRKVPKQPKTAAAAPPKPKPVAAAPSADSASESEPKKKRKAAHDPTAQRRPSGSDAHAGSGDGPPTNPGKKARQAPDPLAVLAPTVLAAEGRCWDPDVALQESLPRVGNLSHELLAVEARRVAGLRRLRLSFGEATRKLQLRTPLVGGFERWHFGWLLAVSGAADPLLPLASSSAADAALASELEGAGASPVAAAAVTATLSREAGKEAEGMAAR